MEPTEMPEDSQMVGAQAPRTRTGRWAEACQSRTGTIVIMSVTAAIILAVTYLVNQPTASGGGFTAVLLSGRASGPPPRIGKTAPDFTATTVDGRKVTLSGLRGRRVWLTFGASWCPPCRAEYPDIEAAYKKHRSEGLAVLGIFIQEDVSTVKEYAARAGLTFPKVADPNSRIAGTYRIVGLPTHYFIDRRGVLRMLKIGGMDPPAIEEALSELSNDANRRAE